MELAIAEQKARAAKMNEPLQPVGTVLQPAETVRRTKAVADEDESRAEDWEQEIMDLKIMNKGKDYLIDELKKDRKMFVDRIEFANRTVGELETKLLQIESAAPPRIGEGE